MASSKKTKAPRRATKREPTLREEIAASGETEIDEGARAEREDREELGFLGREFLTWLVFHADEGNGELKGDRELADFRIVPGGKLTLSTMGGVVSELVLKGSAPASSPELRYAIAGGLSVKELDLRLDEGDRAWLFALEARHLDLKRVKLPALMTEEDDARTDERLHLIGRLDRAVRVAFAQFLELRSSPAWTRTTIPALRRWLAAFKE
jgi:hypothetical protein